MQTTAASAGVTSMDRRERSLIHSAESGGRALRRADGPAWRPELAVVACIVSDIMRPSFG